MSSKHAGFNFSKKPYFNTRKKHFVDDSGVLHCYEIMMCNREIFRDSDCDYVHDPDDFYRSGYFRHKDDDIEDVDPSEVSRRRAKRKIFDYVICNPFDCFVTLTLDAKLIDRNDYKTVINKLNRYLDNRVRRNGLIYVGVPEVHKNGGLHFHFAMNSSALKLVDSGTVSIRGIKAPMRVGTALRRGIPQSEWHTVYNVADWKFGFSTAIKTYGERGAVAHYLSKELNKTVQKSVSPSGTLEKIGGRWYLSGGKLLKPFVELCDSDNAEMYDSAASYDFECLGGLFRVKKFRENGELLKC